MNKHVFHKKMMLEEKNVISLRRKQKSH